MLLEMHYVNGRNVLGIDDPRPVDLPSRVAVDLLGSDSGPPIGNKMLTPTTPSGTRRHNPWSRRGVHANHPIAGNDFLHAAGVWMPSTASCNFKAGTLGGIPWRQPMAGQGRTGGSAAPGAVATQMVLQNILIHGTKGKCGTVAAAMPGASH